VRIPQGYRSGLHNLRHSLSKGVVNQAKMDPETAKGTLPHNRIHTALALAMQGDAEEARAAQGTFLKTLRTRSGAAR
jgi:hypothetical protein